MKTPTFGISQKADELYYFDLMLNTGEVILHSQGYQSLADCHRGIESVQRNGVNEKRYKFKQNDDGLHYFNLTAGNNRIIATSPTFTTINLAEEGMQLVIASVSTANLSYESDGIDQRDESTPEEIPTPAPEADNSAPVFPKIDQNTEENQPNLLAYLNIKPPSSKTQVEFTEVFSVPLDSFYNRLNEVIHAEKVDTGNVFVEKTNLLDQRPKRWYKELRDINADLVFLTKELNRKRIIKNKAEEALDAELAKDTLDDSQLELLEQSYFNKNNNYRAVQPKLDVKEAEKATMLRLIKTNGYLVEDVDKKSALFEAGYSFSISKPIPKGRGFKPMSLGESFDFSSDKSWQIAENKMYKGLFDTGAIKPEGKELYTSTQSQLVSLAKNDVLSAKRAALEGEISAIDEQLVNLKSQIELNKTEIAEWQKDKEILAAGSATFLPFSIEYYPMFIPLPSALTTVDHAKSEGNKLSNWITRFTMLKDNLDEENQKIRAYNQNRHLISPEPKLYSIFRPVRLRLYQMNRLKINWGYNYGNVNGYYHAGLFYPEIGIVYSREYAWMYVESWGRYGIDVKANEDYAPQKFFENGIAVCDRYMTDYKTSNLELNGKLEKLSTEKSLAKSELDQININGLSKLRQEFFKFWNDSENEYLQDITFEVIYPDTDPLTDFLVDHSQQEDKKQLVKTYFYSPTEDGYYNQYGQSLRDFMNNTQLRLQPNVSLFPILDTDGNYSGEVVKAVKNPQKSEVKPNLPVIKFIESYQIEIGWKGYGLSELSHTINLFPGETKELLIEKKTKITSKTNESRKEGEESKQHVTSSFEDNLQNTFSEQEKEDLKSENKQKKDTNSSNEASQSESQESNSSSDVSAKVSANWGWGSADVSAKASKSQKNTSASSAKTAFSLAQSSEGLRASNQSKDILKKNINNSIKKVANDTSKNNKVEVSSISSEEFQEDVTNKEIIKLENPNIGRTVNYNFFQVQNQFATSLKLTDVKIVINSGQEIIEGTGIQDMRVYELEEFGKIYANSSQTDHDVLVSSIVARQVFKHYSNFLPDVTAGNGALHLDKTKEINHEMIKVLTYTSEQIENFKDKKELLDKIKDALESLKAIPFSFKEQVIQEETILSVNAGAYHMEASVGMIPATEAYLEELRALETKSKQAELNHLEAKTKAGVFHQPLPQGITTLAVGDKDNIVISTEKPNQPKATDDIKADNTLN